MLRDGGAVKLPPALVERHPGEDADRSGQLLQHGIQFRIVDFPSGFRGAAEFLILVVADAPASQRRPDQRDAVLIGAAAVGHVLHDQDAQPVAVVVPAPAFHLDVLAQHVEAERADRAQLIFHRLIAGIGHQPVHAVALVQQPAQKQRLAVQAEARAAVRVPGRGELAHAEIALDRVILGLHVDVVQERVVRTPGPEAVQMHDVGAVIGDAAADDFPVFRNRDDRLAEIAAQLEADIAGIVVCLDLDILHVAVADILHPHGLPDAAARRIPHAAVLQALLAVGVQAGIAVIRAAHDQLIARQNGAGHIQRKRRIAAAVAADRQAGEEHLADLVDRLKVQQRMREPGFIAEAAPVPEHLARLQLLVGQREFRTQRKRHADAFPRILAVFFRGSGDLEFPHAVEIRIAASLQQHARIFRQRTGRIEFFTPGAHQAHLPASFPFL